MGAGTFRRHHAAAKVSRATAAARVPPTYDQLEAENSRLRARVAELEGDLELATAPRSKTTHVKDRDARR